MTAALSPAESARLAAFDAAPDAPESYAATVERMARAMYAVMSADVGWDWAEADADTCDHYRRLAAAAYRAEHEGDSA